MTHADTAPPNVDLDTERLVLGQILDWPDGFTLYDGAGLTSRDFYRAAHAWIWDAASGVASDGGVVGQPSVSRALRDAGRFDEVGAAYFGAMTAGVPRPHRDLAADLVRRLQGLSAARRTATHAHALAARCDQTRESLEPEELAGHIAALDEAMRVRSSEWGSDAAGQVAAMFDARARDTGTYMHLGVSQLDDAIGGLRPGHVCGIMARTSVGKTLLACHVARTAVRAGVGQVLVSLEMPKDEIAGRLARAEFGLSRHTLGYQMDHGLFDAAQYQRIFAGLDIFDEPGLDLSRIAALVRTVQRQRPISLVTIDYLGLLGGDRSLSSYERISAQIRDAKDYAKRLKVALVLLIQVSRMGGQDGSERLTLTSSRDSGVIEEGLDQMVGLRRLDRSPRLPVAVREQYRDIIWAEVLKNRHGMVTRRETAIRVNPISLALTEDPELEVPADLARVSAQKMEMGR